MFKWLFKRQRDDLAHQHPIIFQNEIQINERIEKLIPFMFEFQKQYFESLKFSLNIWAVINSGAAIALMSKGDEKYLYNIVAFLLASLLCGIGSFILFMASREMISRMHFFVLDGNLNYHNLINSMSNTNSKLLFVSYFLLLISYGSFVYSIIYLLL